jgi:hypothetical protein
MGHDVGVGPGVARFGKALRVTQVLTIFCNICLIDFGKAQ